MCKEKKEEALRAIVKLTGELEKCVNIVLRLGKKLSDLAAEAKEERGE